MARSALIAFAVIVLSTHAGCTLIGLGVGANTSAGYEDVTARNLDGLEPGTELRVRGARSHPWTEGELIGVHGDELVLEVSEGKDERATFELGPASEVQRSRGTYAGTGALVGLALDVAAVVSFVVICANTQSVWC